MNKADFLLSLSAEDANKVEELLKEAYNAGYDVGYRAGWQEGYALAEDDFYSDDY